MLTGKYAEASPLHRAGGTLAQEELRDQLRPWKPNRLILGLMNPLLQAVHLLEHAQWAEAHVIVQQDDSAIAAWLHGLVHVIEGDRDNARYWFRRAGRGFVEPVDLATELAEVKRELATKQSA